MAPLVKELESRKEIDSICCITAQHRQMLDDVLTLFAITPDYDLDIMESGQSLYTITSKCLLGMEEVFAREKPDLVLVHGDTSTTFAGALAAFYRQIAVGHVEAGLRTYDKYSPFPEEMNRKLVGDIADLHFCPTAANRENLRKEGISDGVFITGNTVIDALKTTVVKDYHFSTELLNELDYAGKKIILVTCHRRENYGQPMANIMTALRRIAAHDRPIGAPHFAGLDLLGEALRRLTGPGKHHRAAHGPVQPVHQPQVDLAGLVVLLLDIALHRAEQVVVARGVALYGHVAGLAHHQQMVVLVQHAVRSLFVGHHRCHLPDAPQGSTTPPFVTGSPTSSAIARPPQRGTTVFSMRLRSTAGCRPVV